MTSDQGAEAPPREREVGDMHACEGKLSRAGSVGYAPNGDVAERLEIAKDEHGVWWLTLGNCVEGFAYRVTYCPFCGVRLGERDPRIDNCGFPPPHRH